MDLEKENKLSAFKVFGVGCLGFVLLFSVGVWFVYSNVDTIVVSIAEKTINRVLDETRLPEHEKSGMRSVFKKLLDDVKSGKIDQSELERVSSNISHSGLIQAMTLRYFELDYLQNSNLSDHEKSLYSIHLSRYRKALLDGTIKEGESRYAEIVSLMSVKKQDGSEEILRDVRLEDLKKVLEIMRERADFFAIEERYYEIDFGLELEKIIKNSQVYFYVIHR